MAWTPRTSQRAKSPIQASPILVETGAPQRRLSLLRELPPTPRAYGPKSGVSPSFLGGEGADWRLLGQSLFVGDGQVIDRLTVEKDSGKTETLYFEISDFYRAGD